MVSPSPLRCPRMPPFMARPSPPRCPAGSHRPWPPGACHRLPWQARRPPLMP
ncbi:hypothetical protein U9M48_009308, partial [Paspalum notatum var. saurae]